MTTHTTPMDELTSKVLKSLENTTDPRFKFIMSTLVKKAHEFLREVDLTPQEWFAAIEFLTATGQICDDKRQEFILLSDTLGLSMMTVVLDQERKAGIKIKHPATEATVMGPYYWEGAPMLPNGSDIAPGVKGHPTLYRGTVYDTDGHPLSGALLDIWSGDGEGTYDMQIDGAGMAARARIKTDQDGKYWYWSICPYYYPIPMDGPVGTMIHKMQRDENRPGHIHMRVSADQHEEVVTHLFVANSPYIESDVVFGVRDGLVVDFKKLPAGTAPDGRPMERDYFVADYDYYLYPQQTK